MWVRWARKTHAVGQPDDSVHRAALEEVIACWVSVPALEPDVLRSRVRVAGVIRHPAAWVMSEIAVVGPHWVFV